MIKDMKKDTYANDDPNAAATDIKLENTDQEI